MRLLGAELCSRGFDVVTTFEPGDTPLGKRLREAFLETEEIVSPTAELLLFAADRAQHVDHLIRPALSEGKIVISDRYADATRAYQGAGRGFSEETIEEVIRIATSGLKPDLTLFFELSIEESLSRAGSRESNNRMDIEKHDFYERVRSKYHELIAGEPTRFAVIDAARPIEDISRDAAKAVLSLVSK